MTPRLVLVQVGRSSRLTPRELKTRAQEEASRSMWGTSCNDAQALKRECFTCQRCGQTGTSSGSNIEFDAAISIVLVDGDSFVGLLMGSYERGALFIYNVCVEHSHRGKRFAAQLIAWLSLVHTGPCTLTVYGPKPSLFRGNRLVFEEVSSRFKTLLTMYARYGFEIVRVTNDMVLMRAAKLRNLPPPTGKRIAS